jgi:hypothetical protein
VQPELNLNDLWKVYKFDEKVRIICNIIKWTIFSKCTCICYSGANWSHVKPTWTDYLRKWETTKLSS